MKIVAFRSLPSNQRSRREMPAMIFAASALALILATTASAQPESGELVPCSGCESLESRPYPQTGAWFNPDRSGAGFTFEIQNGILLGYYYGYDEEGAPLWYLFSGPLEVPEEGTDALWSMSAALQSFRGGACLSCEYVPPDIEAPERTITLEFQQPNHARFAVDGGDSESIVPILYGAGGFMRFEEFKHYVLPELEGAWVAVVENAEQPSGFNRIALDLITQGFGQDIDGYWNAYFVRPLNAPELADFGSLQCGYLDGEDEPPVCNLNAIADFEFAPDRIDYRVPLGYLSDSRIFGEAENGSTIHLYRLDYD